MTGDWVSNSVHALQAVQGNALGETLFRDVFIGDVRAEFEDERGFPLMDLHPVRQVEMAYSTVVVQFAAEQDRAIRKQDFFPDREPSVQIEPDAP